MDLILLVLFWIILKTFVCPKTKPFKSYPIRTFLSLFFLYLLTLLCVGDLGMVNYLFQSYYILIGPSSYQHSFIIYITFLLLNIVLVNTRSGGCFSNGSTKILCNELLYHYTVYVIHFILGKYILRKILIPYPLSDTNLKSRHIWLLDLIITY